MVGSDNNVKFTFVHSCPVYTSILLPVTDLLLKYVDHYLLKIYREKNFVDSFARAVEN